MDEWVSGDVRLICGDCLEVLPTLEAGSVDAVVTDPPYGIGASRDVCRHKHRASASGWDDKAVSMEHIAACISFRGCVIIWGGNHFSLPPSRGWLVWDKKQPEKFTLSMAELAWTNLDRPTKIFRKHPATYRKSHPTQKPVELMAWCLSFIPDDSTIIDPFMGSGTTGVACVKTGRKFIGIEKERRYFDIAVKRIKEAQESLELLTA